MTKRIAKLSLLVIAAIAIGVLWQRSQLAALALTRIDPLPETRELVAQERYAEAANYLAFFMDYPYVQTNPDAQALQREIEAVRDSLGYQANKLREGLLSGTSDETIGQAAGVATDFFVIGDLRDLAKQGLNWAQGEETDAVIAALAAIGVLASAAQVAGAAATVGTAGAAAPSVAAATAVKGGTVVLKAARKLGKLPPWLGKTLIKEAKVVKDTRKLDSVAGLFGDTYTLAKTPGGLTLLSQTQDAASLKRMAGFAETFGRHSATLYRIGGETVLKTAHRAEELGQDTIKLAATYGRQGLHLLDQVGAIRFVKYSARASKIAYKGDLIRLIARLLMQIPTWLLSVLAGLGIAVWIPWRWLMTNTSSRSISAQPTLCALLILLPLSTLADSALSPSPILKHGACPSGYRPSSAYCVPGSKARPAIDKLGTCPSGYTPSGAYCLAGSQARAAIAKIGSSCPSGWSPSGAYCLRRR